MPEIDAASIQQKSSGREQDNGQVILVDETDRVIGTLSKVLAHQNGGRLHRAFSVFILNSSQQMLLQRRSLTKYHFSGLWTNACCSHPRPGEKILDAAQRRVFEELAIHAVLNELFTFIYRADDPISGLTEHELDHVLMGHFDGTPLPDPSEVEQWRWVPMDELTVSVAQQPEIYTPWFIAALPRVLERQENK